MLKKIQMVKKMHKTTLKHIRYICIFLCILASIICDVLVLGTAYAQEPESTLVQDKLNDKSEAIITQKEMSEKDSVKKGGDEKTGYEANNGSYKIENEEEIAGKNKFDYSFFLKIPVLHEGRVKPIDSFARHYMKAMNKGRIVKDISVGQWLIGILFHEKDELNRKIFNIENPEVVSALGLKWWKKHRYSYSEISESFGKNREMIGKIVMADRNKLSLEERQFLDIYFAHNDFTNLLGSISVLFPLMVQSEDIYKSIGSDRKYLLYQDIKDYISTKKENIIELLKNKNNVSSVKSINSKDRELIALVYMLRMVEQDRFSNLFKVIPPPWKEDKDLWFSPWEILEKGRSNVETKKIFDLWTNLVIAYRDNNSQDFLDISKKIYNKSIFLSGENAEDTRLEIEVFYNELDPFFLSIILYIIVFLLILLSYLISSKFILRMTEVIFFLSLIIHTFGLILRVYIMQRPPVATLFESILFVSLVITFYSAVIILRKSKFIGLLSGAISGMILLFVAKGYESGGDTMGMLAAVLDTNFWLATHVMTITIGYGCSFIVGMLAHFYLINKIVSFKNIDSKSLEEVLISKLKSSVLVALFFTVVGTILGGIWADQSWGRFWGWDPKENGAMLLSLWLIWVIHGKFSGHFKDYSFAVAASFTNIIVVISWFGVNLLNVGLHSYGFTDSIALNLVIFVAVEVSIVSILAICYKRNIHFGINRNSKVNDNA